MHCSGGGMGQLCQSLALLQHLRHSLYCFEGVFYHKLEGVDVAEILDEKLDSLMDLIQAKQSFLVAWMSKKKNNKF